MYQKHCYLVCPAIVLTALANSNCVSNHSEALNSVASVKIMNAARVSRPGFARVGGESLKGRHKVALEPGSHEAEVALNWPNGPKEKLLFPVEVPEGGEYFLEVLPFPPRRPFPMRTGSSQAFTVLMENIGCVQPPDVALAAMAVATAVLVPTHFAEILCDLPDRLPAPVQMVTLRLRKGSERGSVVDWRRYDHPDRRPDDAGSHDLALAVAGTGGIGEAKVVRKRSQEEIFQLIKKLNEDPAPPVSFPALPPPRLGREFDF